MPLLLTLYVWTAGLRHVNTDHGRGLSHIDSASVYLSEVRVLVDEAAVLPIQGAGWVELLARLGAQCVVPMPRCGPRLQVALGPAIECAGRIPGRSLRHHPSEVAVNGRALKLVCSNVHGPR